MPAVASLARETRAFFTGGSAAEPRLFFAPGRANLLGAHLDYNGGCVLPVALSRGTCMAIATRADRRLRLRSAQFVGEDVELAASELRPRRTTRWSAYCEGALYTASRAFGGLPGLDISVHADLPMGKGLSSSASIECVTVYALARMLEVEPSVDEMIRLAHEAETEYVGVRCGILDQAAILLAREDSALLFDCLELTREHLPLDPSRLLVAIADSGVQRELSNSAFNERVAECTRALSLLQERVPGITCLRDLSPEAFEANRDFLPPVLARRVAHVVGEVERTVAGAQALREGDLGGFGAAMTGAHHSLRDLYQVSTPELDALAAACHAAPGCYGGRLTGAGFGGCVAAIVHPDAQEAFAASVLAAYRQATGRGTTVQWYLPAGGPREVTV